CQKIKKDVSDFEMIFIGAGPDQNLIEESSQQYNWIHYIGPLFNNEKIPFFIISKLVLMPGLVGLAIIECFVLETPLISTNISYHSPEINYLKNGYNGIICKDDLEEYTNVVIELLKNENKRNKLIDGCKDSITKYTIDKMVFNYCRGIIKSLEH
ncbi:MAG: glycosyltransferase, partial [Bacteroidales bacterium]|nr:glycosyltransferase [Bacteroidales bacterium]